jgi:hypothetical protein
MYSGNNKYRVNFGQNADLSDRLLEYLKYNNSIDDLEVKPDEYFYTQKDKETVEKVNKDYSTKLDKQLDIISKNIVIKFFELNDEKFQAVMKRIALWRI